jgi:hypothetical protein
VFFKRLFKASGTDRANQAVDPYFHVRFPEFVKKFKVSTEQVDD